VVLGAVLAGGCGGRPVYPVHGLVLLDGRPTPGALVVFHAEPPEEGEAVYCRGVAGPDGNFRLTTYCGGDGAPAGNYVVCVTWHAEGEGETDDRIPPAYRHPTASPLRATVRTGVNELGPFRLTRHPGGGVP
jgi:hypothetical protein